MTNKPEFKPCADAVFALSIALYEPELYGSLDNTYCENLIKALARQGYALTRTEPAAPSSELDRESAYPKEIGILAYKNVDYDVFPQLANVAPSVKYVRADENEMLEFTEDVDAVLSLYENRAQGDGKERQRIETLRAYISALTKDIEKTKQTAAGHYVTWQCTEAGLREEITVLESDNKRLREAVKGALGYMRNARIDLETGAPKRTAVNTLGGGITMVEAALAQTDGKAGE